MLKQLDRAEREDNRIKYKAVTNLFPSFGIFRLQGRHVRNLVRVSLDHARDRDRFFIAHARAGKQNNQLELSS